jgi:hypothetical protein
MVKKAAKPKVTLASIEKEIEKKAEKEPKTIKGKSNKAITGDGRKNPNNLTPDELVAGIMGFGNKKQNKKRK